MTDANATPNTPPTRASLEAQLAERAHTDDAFRAELIADPAAVVRRELRVHGVTLADGVTIQLHHETPTALHLVLPTDPAEETELDDAALDLVAGGESGEISSYCEIDMCTYV